MRLSTVFLGQGIYYLLTGVWPLLSIETFMQVTGPKTDIWLVKMVGLLTVSIAIMLLVAARKNATGILILAICAALSYMAIDIYYVLDGTIDKIYLADAVVECILLLLFIFSRKNR